VTIQQRRATLLKTAMQKRLYFSLCSALMTTSVLLWTGCVTTQQVSSANRDGEEAQVRERLAEIFHAAERKDLARLDSYHWYGPHFTKFAGTGKRMDAAAAREGEHKGLSALAGLKFRAGDLQVDVFSDTAVATFIAAASFKAGADTVTKRERGTLVLVKRSGSWKIVHEHFSAAE
jgi:ketosteroid isomerase-like protein